MQLAAIVEKPRECRTCGRKNPKAYLEIEGVVVIVLKSDPYPFGGSIFLGRSVFCNIKCFQEFLRKEYNRGIKEKEVRIGWRKNS